MSLIIPDVSEFQNVDFSVFSGPIIVRAHNSTRPDNHWAQHAAGASRQSWWAAYQYLTKNVDPAAAARAFLATLGDYRPNVTILDLEEGDGDQSGRQHAWLSVMAGDPAKDWTYSGDYFVRSHGLDADWIAAYQSREPTTAHTLWQFSDKQPFPGIGNCDASTFNGTVADLIALTSGTPQPSQEEDTMPATLFRLPDGTVLAAPKNGARPWWVPNNETLALLQFAQIVDTSVSEISDPQMIAGLREIIADATVSPAPIDLQAVATAVANEEAKRLAA